MNWRQGLFRKNEPTCLRCGEKKLRVVNFIRATVLIDGRRAPDSWTLYQCDGCSARLRRHLDGHWSEAGEEAD